MRDFFNKVKTINPWRSNLYHESRTKHAAQHDTREHNPSTQTRMRIEETCISNDISHNRKQQFPRQKF
jgi:hypothetical protein